MKKPILEERKIIETIEKLTEGSFTILDFMKTFKELFPNQWQKLVERFGLFGEKKKYTVATYLANRLYLYSHKSESCLEPFRKYKKGGKGDYRRTNKKEIESFGSPWIAIYRRRTRKQNTERSNRMARRNEWQEFFDGHAPVYMDNSFTKNTVKEVDFVLEELKLRAGSFILDVGCGTGRHAIELAKQGYQITGIDLSKGMLKEAEKAAKKAKVKVEWVHADATRFKSDKLFDAAICLCEGAFGLLGMGDDPIEHDLTILRNINAVLKRRARLILTALNACAMIRQHTQKDVEDGRFDPSAMVEIHPIECETSDGKKSVMVKERGFVPTELVMLFRQAGFEVEHIWGGTAGNWGKRKINLDEVEIMVIGRKVANLSNRGFAT
jgi:ubiquinone/menaquinone biosynthesis C-methylase UbiE